MGPTWVLSAPDGPHIDAMNLAIRVPPQYKDAVLQVLAASYLYNGNRCIGKDDLYNEAGRDSNLTMPKHVRFTSRITHTLRILSGLLWPHNKRSLLLTWFNFKHSMNK